MMNEIDYKQLIEEGKSYLKLEFNYTKLTAVEKLSKLLSAIAIIVVLVVLVSFVLMYTGNIAMKLLEPVLESQWAATLIVALFVVALLVLVLLLRKPLIVNPITRYLTKLFLSPDDEE